MTVYWIDPYIDTPNGGIHGTTGTARSGTYSNPWGFNQLFWPSATSTINGTNLTSGDEIRLKGQSLASYYHNIGTTGNKVPITDCPSSGDSLVYNSSYNTNVDSWRTAIGAQGSDTVGVFVVHDPDLLGTEKWTIITSNTGVQTTGQDRIKVYPNSSNSPYSAYFNALEGITTSKNLEVAFIDPDWYHTPTFTSNTYYFSFTVSGVTITDGWDSETTRNGVTILILRGTNTSSNMVYLFNNGNKGICDLPNTHLVDYTSTAYQSYKLYTYNLILFSQTNYLKLGSIVHPGQNAWHYFNTSSSSWQSGGEPYSIDIGKWANGRYIFMNNTANSTYPVRIRIQNMFFGMGLYFHGRYHDLHIGNLFMQDQYTQNTFFYTYNDSNTINFLPDAHIYGSTSSLQAIDGLGSIGTVGSGVTITTDRPAKYPGFGSGGPTNAGTVTASSNFIDMNRTFKLAAANWYDAKVPKAPSDTSAQYNYTYGHFNTAFGVLECDSDYNNINAMISTYKSTYISTSNFVDQSMTFAKNTYDNKPIMLWTRATTSLNSTHPALISFNDSDDMIVKCTNNPQAGNLDFFKSLVYDTPELTGMNTLTFQQDIEKIGTGVATSPTVRLFPIKKSLPGSGLLTSQTSDSTKWTYTYTFNANVLDSDVNFIGSTILFRNNTGADANSGVRIKPPVFTKT